MKKNILFGFLLLFFQNTQAQELDWRGILGGVVKILSQKDSSAVGIGGASGFNLSEKEIAAGLKEALNIGAKNSSLQASSLNGFFGNAIVKILFPPEVQKVEKTLRQFGFSKQCDNFILALNRGAEKASEKAAPVFINAISKMTIQDAVSILGGDKYSATNYLKRVASDQLAKEFSPIIKQSLAQTSATQQYTQLATLYNAFPTTRSKINPDIQAYATQKAVDGIFYFIGEEEAKIRENPAARVTDLLKKVFNK